MFFFDRPGQHDDFASMLWYQGKTLLRGADIGQLSKRPAKTPDLYPQARAMRFVNELCSECLRQELISRHVSGPRFTQRTCESE